MTLLLVQLVVFPYNVRPEDASPNWYTQQKHVNDKLRSDWLIAGVAPLVQPLEVQKVPALSIDKFLSWLLLCTAVQILCGYGTEKMLLALGKKLLDVLRQTVNQRGSHLL